jgi:hypothetical protein
MHALWLVPIKSLAPCPVSPNILSLAVHLVAGALKIIVRAGPDHGTESVLLIPEGIALFGSVGWSGVIVFSLRSTGAIADSLGHILSS